MRHKIIPYQPHLKEVARKLRKNMTLSEALLWNKLKRKQMLGYDFDRQRPINRYVVDFYCKTLFLAIEIDGESHNLDGRDLKDARRQRRLESLGVRFLRFQSREVVEDMDSVLLRIEAWLERHAGGPTAASGSMRA